MVGFVFGLRSNVLSRPTSDHCPIYLEFDLEDWGPPFWLETMWLKENSFIQSVPEWWNDVVINGWMGFQLVQKLKFVKKKKIVGRKSLLVEWKR